MTKPAAKLGDPGTDHDGFPPTPIVSGSPDVWIDGLPAARVGDPLAPHAKPKHPPHPRQIAAGSTTVLVNGKPLALTGSAVDCGGVIIGSGSVVVGDMAPTCSKEQISKYFNEHFLLIDKATGKCCPNMAYGINGKTEAFEGISNQDGKTQLITGEQGESISLEYIFQLRAGTR